MTRAYRWTLWRRIQDRFKIDRPGKHDIYTIPWWL